MLYFLKQHSEIFLRLPCLYFLHNKNKYTNNIYLHNKYTNNIYLHNQINIFKNKLNYYYSKGIKSL